MTAIDEKSRPGAGRAHVESRVGETTASIGIRLATEQDAGRIHALIVELAKATGLREKVTSKPEHFLRHGFGEPPAFQALIAERADTPLGLCLFFYSFSSWRGEVGVYVQDLYVAAETRGSGLGRRLIAETARLARQRGATYLRLSVATKNSSAQDFYRAIGLTKSDDECIFQAVGAAFDGLAAGRTGELPR
ncbi:MAG: GNAT family N-acetyltransferase [Woeseia sp.]